MKYELYRPQEMSAEQWHIYAALRDARAIYDDPFFDPDFARLVGEVRDDTRIGFASDKKGVFAVWALHVRPGNWARPVGAPFSDWNGPILAEDTGLSVEEILAGFDISGMTTQGFKPNDFAETDGLRRVGANLSDLSEGWDAFLADQVSAWPKHFKKMRRVYRNIDRDFPGWQISPNNQRSDHFQRVLDLKQQQFVRTGYHNVLEADWTRALLDRLRSFEGPRLRARLMTLDFDGQLAAGEFNLQSDTVMHGWITSFDQAFSSYSPGNILLQEVLKQMPDEGLNIYDSGPGLDHYKRHYTNFQAPIDIGVIAGRAAPFQVSRLAGQAWRFGEHVMPLRARSFMARARRRMDQIAAVDTTLSGRASGLLNALQNRPV